MSRGRPKAPVNLLFIITDQQRFDALGLRRQSGGQTPNLDRMAADGVRFEKAYHRLPGLLSGPNSILTGHGIEATKIFGNLGHHAHRRCRT